MANRTGPVALASAGHALAATVYTESGVASWAGSHNDYPIGFWQDWTDVGPDRPGEFSEGRYVYDLTVDASKLSGIDAYFSAFRWGETISPFVSFIEDALGVLNIATSRRQLAALRETKIGFRDLRERPLLALSGLLLRRARAASARCGQHVRLNCAFDRTRTEASSERTLRPCGHPIERRRFSSLDFVAKRGALAEAAGEVSSVEAAGIQPYGVDRDVAKAGCGEISGQLRRVMVSVGRAREELRRIVRERSGDSRVNFLGTP